MNNMNKKINILFLCATQPTNFGDLLINKLLIDELSNYGNVYIDSEGVPENFKKYLFCNSNIYCANQRFGSSLKRISVIKFIFKIKFQFTYFFKSPGPHSGINNFKSFINQIALSLIYIVLYSKGIRLNILGCDVHLNNKLEITVERNNNNFFHSYMVRSKENLKMLKYYGFKKMGYIPDIAFLQYKNIIHKTPERKILISFRDISDQESSYQLFSFVKKSVSFFASKGYSIYFRYQVKEDELYNYELFNAVKDEGVFFENRIIWMDDIDCYNEYEFILSNRLHVLLLGALYHSIPIGYMGESYKTLKIESIFNSIGLNKYLFKNDEFPDYESYLANKDYLLIELEDICKFNYQKCKEQIGCLFN